MNINSFRNAQRKVVDLAARLDNLYLPPDGGGDDGLFDVLKDLRVVFAGCEDVYEFVEAVLNDRKASLASRPKITKHPQLLDKRFRKARTYINDGGFDGLRYSQHSDGEFNSNWHFFQTGDLVEFKSPEPYGQLVQVRVEIRHWENCDEAWVHLGASKPIRVTEAPPMRLVRE